MQPLPAHNTLQTFIIDEAQLFSLYNSFYKKPSHISSMVLCQQLQEPCSTHQELNNKFSINAIEEDVKYPQNQHHEQNEQQNQNQQQDKMDFIGVKKGKGGRWEDRFQIPKTIMIYHEVHVAQYAYELDLQKYYEENQEIQVQYIEIKNQQKPIQKQVVVFDKSSKRLDRKMRVQRYLMKRAKRCFIKKVNYACRKVVADQRVRVKGRFVTKKISDEIKDQNILNQINKQKNVFYIKQQ